MSASDVGVPGGRVIDEQSVLDGTPDPRVTPPIAPDKRLQGINGDLTEADFWPGITSGLLVTRQLNRVERVCVSLLMADDA